MLEAGEAGVVLIADADFNGDPDHAARARQQRHATLFRHGRGRTPRRDRSGRSPRASSVPQKPGSLGPPQCGAPNRLGTRMAPMPLAMTMPARGLGIDGCRFRDAHGDVGSLPKCRRRVSRGRSLKTGLQRASEQPSASQRVADALARARAHESCCFAYERDVALAAQQIRQSSRSDDASLLGGRAPVPSRSPPSAPATRTPRRSRALDAAREARCPRASRRPWGWSSRRSRSASGRRSRRRTALRDAPANAAWIGA